MNYWGKVLKQRAHAHSEPIGAAYAPALSPYSQQGSKPHIKIGAPSSYSRAPPRCKKICVEEVKLNACNFLDGPTLQKFEDNDQGVGEAIHEVVSQNSKSSAIPAATLKAVKKLIENRICLRLAIQNALSPDNIVIERSPKEIDLEGSNNTRASKFRGVSLNGSKWQIFIVINTRGKKRYLGRFPSEELAARYYDRASIQFNGIKVGRPVSPTQARTNFSYTAAQSEEILNQPGVVRETLKYRRFRDEVGATRKRDARPESDSMPAD